MAAVNVPQQQWMDGSDGHVAMLIDVVMMMRSMFMQRQLLLKSGTQQRSAASPCSLL